MVCAQCEWQLSLVRVRIQLKCCVILYVYILLYSVASFLMFVFFYVIQLGKRDLKTCIILKGVSINMP